MSTAPGFSTPAILPKFVNFARMGGFCGLLVAIFLTLALRAVAVPHQTPAPSRGKVLVARVEPYSAAENAGFRVGDVILSYASRPIYTPFQFIAAERNCWDAAGVTIKAKRGSRIIERTIRPGTSGLIPRPPMSPKATFLYQTAVANFAAKDWLSARDKWQAAFTAAKTTRDTKALAWICGQVGSCWMVIAKDVHDDNTLMGKWTRDTNLTAARDWFQRALEYARKGDDRAANTVLLLYQGRLQLNLGNIESAYPNYEQAYSLALADGNEVWGAEARDWQGLILISRYVPAVANFRNNSATAETDLTRARACCKEAFDIRSKILPASQALAESLRHAGYVASIHGQLATATQEDSAQAQEYYRQALNLYRQVASPSSEIRGVYAEEGDAFMVRGDAINAQRCYRSAQVFFGSIRQNVPDMVIVAKSNFYNNMSLTFAMQGDLNQAEQYAKLSLKICPATEMNPATKAPSFTSLAILSMSQNDFPKAKHYCEQALLSWRNGTSAYREGESAILNLLGLIALSENELPEARQHYQEALKIWQEANPRAEGMAVSLNGLGMVDLAEGKPTDAQRNFQQAYDILHATAGVFGELGVLPNMGRVYLLQNQPKQAAQLLEKAMTILESRRQSLSDLDTRALFMQLYANPCADLLQAYMASNQPEKAFATLERLHARAFADNLAEWRLQLDLSIPPDLRVRREELENSRRICEKDFQRVQESKDQNTVAKAQSAVDQIVEQQRELEADIRQDYIRRLGHDIEYPQPVDLAQAQQALPDGVLALAFAVNDNRAYLFTLTNHSRNVYALPFTQKQLKRRVEDARNIISDSHSKLKRWEGLLTGLYHDLLTPAQAEITDAHSLLICPDGPLNLLPFAALMPAPGRYLIQEKPVTTVASLTVYHSLRATRPSPAASLLAVGNPLTEKTRLEETGKLAREIAQMYAPDATLLLGEQATASALLAKIEQAGIVHLGCHGEVDNRSPFGSRLILTPAKGDNGRLAAWQILHTRLNARLVVIWGCGTALGNENRFEGIMGLPRAFQIAGAQNVLTTLWTIRPGETSGILHDFYDLCRQNPQGKTFAETLQAAQIKAIEHQIRPYDWAAFVLNGVGE